jgi:methylmalonyl-CoA mutase N-terminal domain/subunit
VYINEALKRGLHIDDFAPRLAFYISAHIDFFEEIAKFRAARSVWAKLLKERFGAKDPKSMQLKYAIHTAGRSLYSKQPLNNIVRIACETMAAAIGGAQSIHCCGYDEPIALPTEASNTLALRTQQVIAYETGVARVVDPMGGSYYVESLTARLEEEIWKCIKDIDNQGGMAEAMRTGWLDKEIEEESYRRQKAIEDKEEIVVGVNEFVTEMETTTLTGAQRVPEKIGREQIKAVKELKKTRNKKKVDQSIRHLREKAVSGDKENLIPAIMEAAKSYATLQEMWGTIREAYGLPYDVLGVLESPFKK